MEINEQGPSFIGPVLRDVTKKDLVLRVKDFFRAFRGPVLKKVSMKTLLALIMFQLCFATIALADISPSQVLVLYNADWTGDEPLTEPGQDSQEIAEHYVRMHTDSATGEKPYILGLHCDHGIKVLDEARHLNEHHLAENSDDNRSGVVLKRQSFLFGSDSQNDKLRDSRVVEFVLPGGRSNWNINTLHIEIEPEKGDELIIVENGLIAVKGKIAGNNTDEWTIRVNAKSFVAGSVTVKASCVDVQGQTHSWQADYVDADDVELSCTGADGKRDDQNFLEDVALPVKAFLEDAKLARPDGTLLKDHILFMVVCYGLPRTAIAPCGIARGITDKLNNYGSIIDFGQRLQLLYYDLDKVMGTQIRGYRFAGKSPYSDFFLRSPQNRPLVGKANPFVHPQLYSKAPSFIKGPQPLSYSPSVRSQNPDRFLYFVSRIDAPDALQAKALIDRTVYASVYANPEMGVFPGRNYTQNKERVGALKRSKAGQIVWDKGYRYLYHGGQGMNLLEWGRITSGDGFLNDDISYLPGGIAATIISHNGWKKGEMVQDLKNGVTATVGAAQVYHGAPHIHNRSWWDDDIFYPALLQGKTLGEAWLMNQIHLGWITTFVGDPLMVWAGGKARHDTPLKIDQNKDVSLRVEKDENNNKQVWLQVDLHSTADQPKVAQLHAVSILGKDLPILTFDAKPTLCLGSQKEVDGEWLLTLMDPFGQQVVKKIKVLDGMANKK
ncbi:hypothetical protein [uncultured Desulfuromonas sp.]|uniref:hypothetical protein n=1 Tax=uncultured Desulfuromonas sp. TaxID=181013 RepID=UPI002AAB183B|nr:hypothetical protein [uncultured Desulfuromonas sp.]